MKKLRIAAIILVLAAGCVQAADENVSTTKGNICAADGVRLVYDVRGNGDTALVFIHGWACDRSFWHEQLDHFAQHYRVVSVDLGGHGESQANRDVWSIAAFGGDVKAIVEQLDLTQVALVGHSMGGMVALECARLMPKRVVGVVGVDTLHDAEFEYSKEMTEKAVESLKSDFQKTMASFVRSAFMEGTDPNLVDWVVSKACAANQEVVLGVILETVNLDIKQHFRAAGVPIRCINAEPFPPNNSKTKVETNRKYADFDVVLMQGVGHFPMLEQPKEFNSHLRRVLLQITSP